MAKDKEYVYKKIKTLGDLGKDTLEFGQFTVDGKEGASKVYRISTFTAKGVEQKKRTAICTESEVSNLIELLGKVGK